MTGVAGPGLGEERRGDGPSLTDELQFVWAWKTMSIPGPAEEKTVECRICLRCNGLQPRPRKAANAGLMDGEGSRSITANACLKLSLLDGSLPPCPGIRYSSSVLSGTEDEKARR